MAIADMFLKVQGVTGESSDSEHKGEIDVVSWSWGMQASHSVMTGQATGKSALSELLVVKRVDHASPTLMGYLRHNKVVKSAQLVVRKAGAMPLEYFKIEMDNVRVMAITAESADAELVERIALAFTKVRVTYTPQGITGGRGGGSNVFEADAHASS